MRETSSDPFQDVRWKWVLAALASSGLCILPHNDLVLFCDLFCYVLDNDNDNDNVGYAKPLYIMHL
jgi:hypothetical protein